MSYIDGFVLAVPNENKTAYIKLAQSAAQIFKKYGAIKVVEAWGDDVPEGKVTSFPLAVKREPHENIVFSWIVWPNRETRDEGMKKSMEDPQMKMDPSTMPFDGQRMIFGGFEAIVEQ
jgi:uncharacterized protein YbaA (DUF1428 family)